MSSSILCKECKKEIVSKTAKMFCCAACSAKYNNRIRIFKPGEDKRIKDANCIKCGKLIQINIRHSKKRCICECCKIKNKQTISCKYCGQANCLRPDVCKRHQTFKTLSKYYGFDESVIGTIRIYEEFDRVVNLLKEEYFDNKLSTVAIAEKYGYENKFNLNKLLRSLFNLRELSEAVGNASIQGRLINTGIRFNQYKCGHHITWNGRDIFYRSSYELEYAQQLDKKQVKYSVESLRILYWDSQKQRQRVAIPDFYLVEDNTIVEIKGSYTYDEQNMKDKKRAYIQHGYNFKLFLDKKEVDTSLW